MSVSLAEHQQIVKAILAGDADAARARLRAHIAVQGDRFGDLVANLRQLDRQGSALANR